MQKKTFPSYRSLGYRCCANLSSNTPILPTTIDGDDRAFCPARPALTCILTPPRPAGPPYGGRRGRPSYARSSSILVQPELPGCFLQSKSSGMPSSPSPSCRPRALAGTTQTDRELRKIRCLCRYQYSRGNFSPCFLSRNLWSLLGHLTTGRIELGTRPHSTASTEQ